METPGSDPEEGGQSESLGRTGWLDVMDQNLVEQRDAQRSILGGGEQDQPVSPGDNWSSVPWGYLVGSVEHTSEVPWPEGRGISGVLSFHQGLQKSQSASHGRDTCEAATKTTSPSHS